MTLVALTLTIANSIQAQEKQDEAPQSDLPQSAILNTSLWPEAPVSDKSMFFSAGPDEPPPLVKVEPPIPKALDNDPLQEATPLASLRGQLAYWALLLVKDQPESQKFFVLHGVGVTGRVAQEAAPVATYHATSYAFTYQPQFSPDGGSLVFKVGSPFERAGTHRLYLWKLAAKQLQPVVDTNLNYGGNVFWSPGSRYFAYIKGGDINGKEWQYGGGPLRLYSYNIQTDQSQLIAQNSEVTRLCWTYTGTLLFTQRNPTGKTRNETEAQRVEHSDIYESRATGGTPTKVITGGSDPSSSPDGRWIAFFAVPDDKAQAKLFPDNRANLPLQSALHLFDHATLKRVPVIATSAAQLEWMRDSKQLIVLDTKRGVKGQVSGHISLVDTMTFAVKELAILQAQDYQFINRGASAPNFRVMGLSRDGTYLLVSVSEYFGQSGPFYGENRTLRAINLTDGSVISLAHLVDEGGRVVGWDWHDESGETPNTYAVKAAQLEAKMEAPSTTKTTPSISKK